MFPVSNGLSLFALCERRSTLCVQLVIATITTPPINSQSFDNWQYTRTISLLYICMSYSEFKFETVISASLETCHCYTKFYISLAYGEEVLLLSLFPEMYECNTRNVIHHIHIWHKSWYSGERCGTWSERFATAWVQFPASVVNTLYSKIVLGRQNRSCPSKSRYK